MTAAHVAALQLQAFYCSPSKCNFGEVVVRLLLVGRLSAAAVALAHLESHVRRSRDRQWNETWDRDAARVERVGRDPLDTRMRSHLVYVRWMAICVRKRDFSSGTCKPSHFSLSINISDPFWVKKGSIEFHYWRRSRWSMHKSCLAKFKVTLTNATINSVLIEVSSESNGRVGPLRVQSKKINCAMTNSEKEIITEGWN